MRIDPATYGRSRQSNSGMHEAAAKLRTSPRMGSSPLARDMPRASSGRPKSQQKTEMTRQVLAATSSHL